MNNLAIVPNRKDEVPAGWEICFVTENVQRSFDTAVQAGASPVISPVEKPWGRTISYVRDLNGCLVEIASPVR